MKKLVVFCLAAWVLVCLALCLEAQPYKVNIGSSLNNEDGDPAQIAYQKFYSNEVWLATQGGGGAGQTNLWMLNSSNFLATVQPEHFGAVGDGATDDSIAVSNAVYFAARKNLAVLCQSPNGYKMTRPLRMPSYVTVQGRYRAREINSSVLPPTFILSGTGAFVCQSNSVIFSKVKIQGSASQNITAGTVGIFFGNDNPNAVPGNLTLDNVCIQHFAYGLLVSNADEFVCSHSEIGDNSTNVCFKNSYLAAIRFENCLVGGILSDPVGVNNSEAFEFQAGDVSLDNCDFGNCTNTELNLMSGGCLVNVRNSNLENNNSILGYPNSALVQIANGCSLKLDQCRFVQGSARWAINMTGGVLITDNTSTDVVGGTPSIHSTANPIDNIYSRGTVNTFTNDVSQAAFAPVRVTEPYIDWGSGEAAYRGGMKYDFSNPNNDSFRVGINISNSVAWVPLEKYYYDWTVAKKWTYSATAGTLGSLTIAQSMFFPGGSTLSFGGDGTGYWDGNWYHEGGNKAEFSWGVDRNPTPGCVVTIKGGLSVSNLCLQVTNAAPANTTTPKLWLSVTNLLNGQVYSVPFYQ